MKKILMLLVCAMSLASPVYAEPTLQETIDWIELKINRLSIANIGSVNNSTLSFDVRNYVESFNCEETNCALVSRQSRNMYGKHENSTNESKAKNSFDLLKLESAKVIKQLRPWKNSQYETPQHYSVSITTDCRKPYVNYKVSRLKEESWKQVVSENRDRLQIDVGDKDLAERIAKAFNHAIKLAGGGKECKDDLF